MGGGGVGDWGMDGGGGDWGMDGRGGTALSASALASAFVPHIEIQSHCGSFYYGSHSSSSSLFSSAVSLCQVVNYLSISIPSFPFF